jgi:hypothetical protein
MVFSPVENSEGFLESDKNLNIKFDDFSNIFELMIINT